MAIPQSATSVVGPDAHDEAAVGSPVPIGGVARTTNPTAVADGDRADAAMDDLGRWLVVPHAARDLIVDNHVSLSVSTTLTLLAAGASGVFRDIVMITVANPGAANFVTIRDGLTNGTNRLVIAIAAGDHQTIHFPVPLKQATAANAWTIETEILAARVTVQAVENV